MMKLLEHFLDLLPLLLSMPVLIVLPLLSALKKRGWTMRSLAVRTGLEEKTVHRIVSEKVKRPHLATIEVITDEIGESAEELGLGAAYNYRLQNAEKKQR
jgi:lambda repressor-like predicted transcriptional regulator